MIVCPKDISTLQFESLIKQGAILVCPTGYWFWHNNYEKILYHSNNDYTEPCFTQSFFELYDRGVNDPLYYIQTEGVSTICSVRFI